MMHETSFAFAPDSNATTATLPIREFDWSSLEHELAKVLVHRDLVRAVSEETPSSLDRVASSLLRVHGILGVLADRCNEIGSTPLRAVLVRAYRWSIEIASHLADLAVETLDRALTTDEAEAFARHAAVSYVLAIHPLFEEVRCGLAGDGATALAWDVETLRAAIERTILDAYAVE